MNGPWHRSAVAYAITPAQMNRTKTRSRFPRVSTMLRWMLRPAVNCSSNTAGTVTAYRSIMNTNRNMTAGNPASITSTVRIGDTKPRSVPPTTTIVIPPTSTPPIRSMVHSISSSRRAMCRRVEAYAVPSVVSRPR